MPIIKTTEVALKSQEDVVSARQLARAWAVNNGFNIIDQTKLVTAASELARNTIIYGKGGVMHLVLIEEANRRGIRMVFEDSGPGIADVQQALQDGFTSGNGLGLGLGGARRLSDEFDIQSEPGKGTRVSITRWRK